MDFSFKFICVGDSGTGKSSLLLRFTHSQYQPTETTIGIEFGSKTIQIHSKTIKLQIWDTAGQESFRSISRAYYRGAIGCLVVYDVSKKDSFQHVLDWIKDVEEYGDSSTRMILVANKIDLESTRQIATRVGMELAAKHNMLYMETSAKTGTNVTEAYQSLANAIFVENNLSLKAWNDSEIKIWEAKGIKVGSQKSRMAISLEPQSEPAINSCC